jgi:hypothetical protein
MSYFYANTRGAHSSPQSFLPSMQQQSGCGGASVFKAATDYVGLVPKGNMGNAPESGCAVDTQSTLLWGMPGTARDKGPHQMFPRPYATTPSMAMGSVEDVPTQSKLIFSHSTANRKSIQTVSDTQFPVFQPLLQSKVNDIPANNYFVEPFLRGGLASRLLPHQRVDVMH